MKKNNKHPVNNLALFCGSTLLTKKIFSLGNPNASMADVSFKLNAPTESFLHSKYAHILVLNSLDKGRIDIKIANSLSSATTAKGKATTEKNRVDEVLNILNNGLLTKEQKVDAIVALNPKLNSPDQQILINQIQDVVSKLSASAFEVLTPNPPYTPIIKAISMDYTATTEGVANAVKMWHYTRLKSKM